MAITSIPVLSDISRTPLIFAGEVDKFNSLISKYQPLTTSGFQTFTSSSSLITYNTVANGGETELLSILINAINSANGNNPCIFTAGHFNSIKTTLEAGANSGVNTDLWRGWKLYNFSELGLVDTTATLPQIGAAMQDNSILVCSLFNNPNMPYLYTILHVIRKDGSEITIEAFNEDILNGTNVQKSVGSINFGFATPFTGFKELYHSGNYDVPKWISGNYTLTADDNRKRLIQSGGSDVNNNHVITVPTNLPSGFTCTFVERYTGNGRTTITPAVNVFVHSNPDSTKRTLNGLSAVAVLSKFPEPTETYNLAGNLKV